MYAPHEHAQHPCHRVLSVACPGFLTVPQGGMSAPPANPMNPQLAVEETVLEIHNHQIAAYPRASRPKRPWERMATFIALINSLVSA